MLGIYGCSSTKPLQESHPKPPEMLVKPVDNPSKFTGSNEYDLLNYLNENGKLWEDQRNQLRLLIEWCEKTSNSNSSSGIITK